MSPYDAVSGRREATKPPVSEFESPKLKMAGKTHSLVANAGFGTMVAMDKIAKSDTCWLCNLAGLGNSIGEEIKSAKR